MINRASILTAGLLLTAPIVSQATLTDEGETLLDTDTGLRWVKPTTTRGRSVSDVAQEMNSRGEFAACRWPSDDEILELFTHLGIPAPGDPIGAQESEDLELAIALLGDTLDAYFDATSDTLDVSPNGAGWTKATYGISNSIYTGNKTLILRDAELVNRIDGTPASDNADVIDNAVHLSPWDGDGDTGVIVLCPNWPAKPITGTEILDFNSQPDGTTTPLTDGDYYIEGDGTVTKTGTYIDIRSSSCADCQNGGKWTTSITVSRSDGAPFAFFGLKNFGNSGNCDDGVGNSNMLYGSDEYWRNECTWEGVTTWGEKIYGRYSPQPEFYEWNLGEGPWLNLQSLTVHSTCGTGSGYEGYSCTASSPAQVVLDNVEVGDAVAVDIDFNPWSTADVIDPTGNAFITVAVKTTSVVNGDPTDFNAADVDPDTLSLSLGGTAGFNGARLSTAPLTQDIDGDGDTDYIFGFRTQDIGITCIDRQLILSGQTTSGIPFAGAADVNMHANCFHEINAAVDVEPFDTKNRVYPNDNYQVLVKLVDLENFAPEGIGSGVRMGSGNALPRDMIMDGPTNIDFEPIYTFDMQDTGIACDDTEVEIIGLYYTQEYVNGRWVKTPAFPSGEPAFKATASIQTEDCVGGCHP